VPKIMGLRYCLSAALCMVLRIYGKDIMNVCNKCLYMLMTILAKSKKRKKKIINNQVLRKTKIAVEISSRKGVYKYEINLR